MKALLHTGPLVLDFTDVPAPEVGPDDVLVRVRAVGICGSDVHGYTGETGRRIPPLVMGHEAAGIVERVGAHVTGFAPGDRVCFDSTVYCNACEACRAGQVNRCARRQVLGVSVPAFRRHGAMAEFVAVPHWIVAHVPEGMSLTEAALLEPVAIAVHAASRAEIEAGATVAVVGAGTIGLFVLQAAKLKGAAQVLVSDLSDHRLGLARRLGADVTVNAREEDFTARVQAETDGRGADVTFEVVGLGATLRQAIAATRMGGTVVLVGNLTPTVEIPAQEVVARELTLRGTYAATEYRACIGLVATGTIDVRPLVSETLPLADGQAAFDRLHAGTEDLVKIVLEP